MTKGILKRNSLSGVSIASSNSDNTDPSSREDSPKPKRVSFDGAEPAKIFQADEWDRSPAEVTLRLTYKDVVELRELDVSLVRTGPLMMERTLSRRPTRQRTPMSPTSVSTEPSEYFSSDSPCRAPSPVQPHNHLEETASPSPTPAHTQYSPRLSPTYQYQAFASKPLPPLLEDASSSSPTSTDRRGRGNGSAISDSYFTFHPAPTSGSPPGLVFRAPNLKGIPSPALAPPSPLMLSSPLPPRLPSSKPSSRPGSPVSLYVHSASRPSSPRLKMQTTPESPKPIVFPALTRRASVSGELSLEAEKPELAVFTLQEGSPPPAWKSLDIADVNASSSSLILRSSKNENGLSSPPPTPVVTRRSGRSLMGWELRRTGSGNGKRGFGLVRKGSAGLGA